LLFKEDLFYKVSPQKLNKAGDTGEAIQIQTSYRPIAQFMRRS